MPPCYMYPGDAMHDAMQLIKQHAAMQVQPTHTFELMEEEMGSCGGAYIKAESLPHGALLGTT